MPAKLYLLILLPVLLSACSSDKDTSATPQKKTGTIFQGQIDSLNKAKQVEDTLFKADQKRRKAINDASTGQ